MSESINKQNAGLFSAAAYVPVGTAVNSDPNNRAPLPKGWNEITLDIANKLNPNDPNSAYSDSTGSDEFRVFKGDTNTKQIVIAFKGSDKLSNWKSDLNLSDQGNSEYQK